MAQRVTVDAEFGVRVTKPGLAAVSVAAVHADSGEIAVSGAGAPRIAEFEHGTRAEVYDLDVGEHRVTYHGERTVQRAVAETVTLADVARYTRPSRYCPSDRMGGLLPPGIDSFGDARARVRAIVDHVHERIAYVVGSGGPTCDAIDTLLAGEGVCRDFAHVCIALCRLVDIPARYTSVYAPGLQPMDFHAVFEAGVDGRWYVFDATRLAPRQTMLRIATGRDAADTPFLATLGCELDFLGATVFATTDGPLPRDDGHASVSLA
ncbi:transglutaminase superfamily protein [Amycolatopsis sulphurea]|uniref:Transglutaminase superfamily protein n=1 Tax=Amycolatopsis sulphurea TaxID=76022 RepID=A0A2A9F7A9_9PSEU|nr:transglutaminase family protein [Amycolatopsis sulphurea]PFG46289.1 transglutaminase superfamily protein [Amycolatopsis sulphurea]